MKIPRNIRPLHNPAFEGVPFQRLMKEAYEHHEMFMQNTREKDSRLHDAAYAHQYAVKLEAIIELMESVYGFHVGLGAYAHLSPYDQQTLGFGSTLDGRYRSFKELDWSEYAVRTSSVKP